MVAAAALLFDYMMTVVVSIVAGVFAIGSALPSANEHKVLLSIGFVAFVTLANLRGARESGTLFAIPTYGFVLSIMVLVGSVSSDASEAALGAGRRASRSTKRRRPRARSGSSRSSRRSRRAPPPSPASRRSPTACRRSGAAGRNAAETLAIMGAIAITMFIGISWLATHVEGVVASEERSVVAQIAMAVFGDGIVGFFVVQFFTAAILILAANTAYQDFPRLASILARDRYLPSQFVNRGDRLVFSNGVIVLGRAVVVMIYIFDASLNALIHLYVVGVFTSFTLSQSGMVKHWIAEAARVRPQ